MSRAKHVESTKHIVDDLKKTLEVVLFLQGGKRKFTATSLLKPISISLSVAIDKIFAMSQQ